MAISLILPHRSPDSGCFTLILSKGYIYGVISKEHKSHITYLNHVFNNEVSKINPICGYNKKKTI